MSTDLHTMDIYHVTRPGEDPTAAYNSTIAPSNALWKNYHDNFGNSDITGPSKLIMKSTKNK
jgi:hypothetical protein